VFEPYGMIASPDELLTSRPIVFSDFRIHSNLHNEVCIKPVKTVSFMKKDPTPANEMLENDLNL